MKTIEIKCKINDSLPLDKLVHFQGNIKSLSEENHEKLKNRILEKGFRYPFHIWIDKEGNHNVLDGHQRLSVLLDFKKQGYLIPDLPIHEVYCETLEEAKEEVLAISSQYGTWEQEELQIYLNDFNIEIDTLSFSQDLDLSFLDNDINIGGFDNGGEGSSDDDIPPIVEKEEYLSQEGTVWQLNNHYLICGSSTDSSFLKTFLEGEDIEKVLVFTDPPYGIDLIRSEKGSIGSKKTANKRPKFLRIEGDSDTQTARDFYEACLENNLEHFVLWGGNYFTDFLPPSPVWFSWFKGYAETMSFSQCELAWTSFAKGGVDHYDITWCGNSMEGGWTDNMARRIHPNQKPVLLMEECIRRRGEGFDTILDGFCGSGSFLIGAEKTGKKYIGFELMPAYADASVKRWVEWMEKNNRPFTLSKDGEEFKDYELL